MSNHIYGYVLFIYSQHHIMDYKLYSSRSMAVEIGKNAILQRPHLNYKVVRLEHVPEALGHYTLEVKG